MKDKKVSRIYRNELYNYYSDDNDYPGRIKKPVGFLLLCVLIALFFIAFKLFN